MGGGGKESGDKEIKNWIPAPNQVGGRLFAGMTVYTKYTIHNTQYEMEEHSRDDRGTTIIMFVITMPKVT